MEPDPFDTVNFPFGKKAGDNKFKSIECPTCLKSATLDHNVYWFLFRDKLSAREYEISGMCQACQDSVFGED